MVASSPERFADQPLRPRPHLAVLFYDSIGDFVVTTPLLRGLREKYPGCTIDYFGGERTRELEEASPMIDTRCSIFGRPEALRDLAAFVAEREAVAGAYDLAINLESSPIAAVAASVLRPRYVVGRCYDGALRGLLHQPLDGVDALHDEFWPAPDLLGRYQGLLETQYIGEIFCRLARVETDFLRTEVPTADPPIATPPVLISTGANRSAKLWTLEGWQQVVRWCAARGFEVGLLGGRPADQARHYHAGSLEDDLLLSAPLHDLRGRLTLPGVAGALARARACVTVDNGIMHLALAVGTPTIALFGASPWRLWAPPVPHLRLLLTTAECTLCEENRYRNAHCLREEHLCMESIRPERVAAALAQILADAGRASALRIQRAARADYSPSTRTSSST